MPITPQQLEERRLHVGSSDMAAVLGKSPWQTPTDVYLDKIGKLAPLPPTDAMIAGNILEPSILDWFEKVSECGDLQRNVTMAGPGPLASNLDGLIPTCKDPVEAKTVAIVRPKTPADMEKWGDEGSDQIPDYVIIQCHVHMICSHSQICHVPVLLAGEGFKLFHVEFDGTLAAMIEKAARYFWETCVIPQVPPLNGHASLQVVKRMRRTPGLITEIDPALAQRWTIARAAAKEFKAEADQAQADVLLAMGDADAATIPGEEGAFTYYETARKGYEVKETTYRTLRLLKKGLPKK